MLVQKVFDKVNGMCHNQGLFHGRHKKGIKGDMYGTNIKRIREKKNITQEGLAKGIGVSRQGRLYVGDRQAGT